MKNQNVVVFIFLFLFSYYTAYSQNTNFTVSLDGIDDYVSIPNSLIKGINSLTIETWFKTKEGGVIIGYQNSEYPASPYNYVPILYIDTEGFLRGMFWSGSITPMTSVEKYNDDIWHHVAIIAGSTSQSLICDGKIIGIINGQIDHLDMNFNQIGVGYTASYPSGNSTWFSFKGQIDETRIWNYERTGTQIVENMHQNFPQGTPGLLAYWKFDDANGTIASDASGNGNHARLLNGAGWSFYFPANSEWALYYDGQDDYVKVPEGIISNYNKLTIETWFKTVSSGVIFGYQNSEFPVLPSNYVPALYVGLDGKVRGQFWNGILDPITSLSTYNDGKWHYVVLVGNENVQNLYIDGKLIGSRNGTIFHGDMIVNQFGIGNTGLSGRDWPSTNSQWFAFTGVIDECRIWEFPFNEAQVIQNMQTYNTLSNYGLLGYWKFNEGNGLLALDLSGKGNTALLVNGPIWVTSDISVEVENDLNILPNEFILYQNYPNPFNPSTTIKFSVLKESRVNITIYNILGQSVSELLNQIKGAGTYTVDWNGGRNSSGIYFYKITAFPENGVAPFIKTKRMILLK